MNSANCFFTVLFYIVIIITTIIYNEKKIYPTPFSSFFATICNGQEIKVKKEIIYVDEVPALKMVGNYGIFKTLKYSSFTISGDALFKQIGAL
jgi:hypothetical protein